MEIKQKIVLETDAGGVKGNSLSGLIAQLRQVDNYIASINAQLASGPAVGPQFTKSLAQIKTELNKAFTTKGPYPAADVAKAIGLDERGTQQVLARLARIKGELNNFNPRAMQFNTLGGAASGIQKAMQAEVASVEKTLRAAQTQIGQALRTPTLSQVHGPTSATAQGGVLLTIPAAQVQASVVGPIPLLIPGSQISATAPAGGHDPSTGQFLPGAGGAGGKKEGKGKGPLQIPTATGELQRVRTETAKQLTEAVTAVGEAGELITTTHDSIEGIIKTSRKTQTGATPLAQFREARKVAEEQFKQAKALLDPRDTGLGMAGLMEKQAAQLKALLSNKGMMSQLSPTQAASVSTMVNQSAGTLQARAAGLRAGVAAQFRNYGMQHVTTRLPGQPVLPSFQPQTSFPPAPPVIPLGKPGPQPAQSRLVRGLSAFSPLGFLTNVVNVTGWAAAVGVLYKSIELASYSLHRFMDIGQQTARLSQVFRGVGGNAKQLTDDILKLASANGRSTEEAMESAVAWSRLGLNRVQVNEAVRVSLMAANVAELSAGEATSHLASLMAVYGLHVNELNGVLGMLNNTSNKYNVTNQDLLVGLTRTAAVAKQAGIPLAELQGIIGAAVGKTGQSGANIGNAVKSILVSLSNPAVQKLLRSYGVEATTKSGDQKSGSEVLRELFVRFQSLNKAEQQNLTMRVAGKTQASRFVAVLDSYVDSQRLAIDAQLNLNSAESENAKILGTVKSQLSGVRAEWDRLVTSQMTRPDSMLGGSSVSEGLVSYARGGKNVLRLANRSPGLMGLVLGSAFGTAGRLVDVFSNLMESPLERGSREFQNELQKHQGAANAHLQKSRLFQTVSEALGVTPENRRGQLIEQLGPLLGKDGAKLRDLVAGGDLKGARALLNVASRNSYASAFMEKMEEADVRNKRFADASGQADKARQEISDLEAQGAATEKLKSAKDRLAEAQKEINDLTMEAGDSAGFLTEEEGTTEEAIARKQEFVNLLKEQQEVMQVIGQLAGQQTLGTASSRNAADLQALQEERARLESAAEKLRQTGGLEAHASWQALQEQLTDVNAQIASRGSPRVQAAIESFDSRSIAIRNAQQEAQGFGVGRTESEKLLNEERRLQEELARVRSQANGPSGIDENAAVRAKQFEIELWNTQEKIQERILELAREERQIRIDASREFQKNLLLAGPGEQLQRLYTSTLLNRKGGISSGEFNALDPAAKRMFYDALGGDAGAHNREEQALLRGRRRSVGEQQADSRAAGERVNRWGQTVNGFTGRALDAFPNTTPLPLETKAKTAADQLGAFAQAVSASTQMLKQFQQLLAILSRTPGGAGAGGGPAPRLGISAGHALGDNGSAPPGATRLDRFLNSLAPSL